jgi:uncharacterized membrane protein YhaH (DUF805 family)
MEPSPTGAALIQFLPLFVVVFMVPFLLWTTVRIARKAGYSGWWSLLMLIPIVNVVVLWVFAFSSWPALTARS